MAEGEQEKHLPEPLAPPRTLRTAIFMSIALVLAAALASVLVSLIVSPIFAKDQAEETSKKITESEHRTSVKAEKEGQKARRLNCTVNNITKGNTRINVYEGLPNGIGSPVNRKRNDELLVILNCKQTFADGHTSAVPLVPTEEQHYLNVLKCGRIQADRKTCKPNPRIPVMSGDGGAVVGTRSPESGPIADF